MGKKGVGCFVVLGCATALAANQIVMENQLPGTPDWGLKKPATEYQIAGYPSAGSIERGESVSIQVSTKSERFSWELYRLGWYGGLGARKVLEGEAKGAFQQTPEPDPQSMLVDCHWKESFKINTNAAPESWVSGVYLIRLTELAYGYQSYLYFVVRDDKRTADFLFQNSLSTDLAYNTWGGSSLYGALVPSQRQATTVSLNRPMAMFFHEDATSLGTGHFLGLYEYNFLRWLERNGYDVKYLNNFDVDRDRELLLKGKVFLSVGHDEYWSWNMRWNLTWARDQGIHLAFFSSNTAYWQVRVGPDSAGKPRWMTSYKEQADNDPVKEPHLKTNQWRLIGYPEDALLGVRFNDGYPKGDIVVRDASHWMFRGTGLHNGDRLRGLLGFESDAVYFSGPRNLERLASSPLEGVAGKYSDMTLYRAPKGALVFAVGSMQWSWGLDDFRFRGNPRHIESLEDPRVAKITENLFAEMLHPHFTRQPRPNHATLLAIDFREGTPESFVDTSGYGRSIICYRKNSTCPERSSKTRTWAAFKKGDFIDAGLEPSLREEEAFTITLDLRTTEQSGQVLIQQRDSHHSPGFMGYDGSFYLGLLPNGHAHFWTWGPDGEEYSIDHESIASLNDGHWHRLSVSRDHDGTSRIYIDGALDSTRWNSRKTRLKPHTIYIGYDPVGPYADFVGDIGNVRIETQVKPVLSCAHFLESTKPIGAVESRR